MVVFDLSPPWSFKILTGIGQSMESQNREDHSKWKGDLSFVYFWQNRERVWKSSQNKETLFMGESWQVYGALGRLWSDLCVCAGWSKPSLGGAAYIWYTSFEPVCDRTNNMTCVPSEDSDQTGRMTCVPSEDSNQPGHPPSLIRIFPVHIKKLRVLAYPLSAQQRLWSNAQADLSLRWAHRSFCFFCHAVAHL